MSKIIAHIDLDAFFVRCEEIKNPSLENKPVAIGKDGRGGIVSTCSYKAREYGVKSGMPMFKAKQLCPDLIIVNGDYNYYEVLSNEFIFYTKQFTSKIEQASIDECYADFTELFKKNHLGADFFKKFQEGLFLKTKLKCSIGVSTTRFLAKMGSDINKPMGITIIKRKDIKNILFNRPIGTYYGIGNKTSSKLKKMGINTIGDLYNNLLINKDNIQSFFHDYKYILSTLDGTSSDEINTVKDRKQLSIGTRETLSFDTSDYDLIKENLIKCFDVCFERFQDGNYLCGGLTIVFRFTNFKTRTYTRKLKTPSDDYQILLDNLLDDYDLIFDNQLVRQVGVTFERLTKNTDITIQMTLFDYQYYENKDPIYEIIRHFNSIIKDNDAKLFRASDLLKEKDGNNRSD